MCTPLFRNFRFFLNVPIYFLQVFLTLLLFLPQEGPAVAEQSELTRISTTERSDGLGHVVRFHMESPADSFKVRQPFVDLIQLKIYQKDVETHMVRVFESTHPYRGVEIVEFSEGVGINIHLEEDAYFLGNAYPDGGSDDVLLGLTLISREKARQVVEGIQPVLWADPATLETEDGFFNLDNESDLLEFEDFTNESLRFEVIVIDPGHGGRDPGAVGYNGVYEKDITLSIALKLGNYIEEHLPDIKVVYTRDDDRFVGLEERGRIANQSQGDLFISLHANSNHSSRPAGSEVYFLGLHRSQEAFEIMKTENAVIRFEDEEDRTEELTREELLIYELANIGNISSSEIFAGLTERQFAERARRRSRGVKQAGFIVLYHASMPAALIELGFISNPQEQRFLTSEYGQNIMASAIFRAVRDYKEKIDRSNGRE